MSEIILEAKEIWVRVRSDYQEALSFARSIGFQFVETQTQKKNEKTNWHVIWLRHENALF